MLKTDVFDRTTTGGAEIPAGAYNLLIGVLLCWGLLVNGLLVEHVSTAWLLSIPRWMFFVGYFASCLYGVYLFNTSDHPVVSFIGYNFVVVPFGLIVNMVVSRYAPDLVLQAIQVTAAATFLMMLAGSLMPGFFQRIHLWICLALLCVIVVEALLVFVLKRHGAWLDWAVAILFCAYIGYDWGRANRIPRTVDNAVDSAAAIYMDIVNLFLRVLRLLGRRR